MSAPGSVREGLGQAETSSKLTGRVFTTGLVLQELLQGFRGARSRDRIVRQFASLPFLIPHRADHVAAADLRTVCRRKGIQVGTIDALLAQLRLAHDLVMLTTDSDSPEWLP